MKSFFNKTQLKERGWSEKMIETLYGEPYMTRKIGRYCTEYLYHPMRVYNIEGTRKFKELSAKYLQRKKKAKEVSNNRKNSVIERAQTLPIKVVVSDYKTVMRKAIEHWNYRQEERCLNRMWQEFDFQYATMDSDQSFLERITVNYIRHNLTCYDRLLNSHNGTTGKYEAIRILQARIYDEIAKAYPAFAEECQRQKAAKLLE